MTRMPAAALAATAATALLLAGPAPAGAAQERGEERRAAPVAPQTLSSVTLQEPPDAHHTREQLERLLRQVPPAVGEVLERDPSLLNSQEYLAPYPALAAFLAQHPEVARNPSFFLGGFRYVVPRPGDRAAQMMEAVSIAVGFLGFMAVLGWLIRAVIDHRRWLRLSRVQTEVHTKLMDRFTGNEDLLAYIQSPAGRRFLESAPITLDGEPRQTAAPFGRILWSLQAGIVLVALGIGFWFAQGRVAPEVAEGFSVLSVIAMALGAGFAVSAVASYVISTRLGLVPVAKSSMDA